MLVTVSLPVLLVNFRLRGRDQRRKGLDPWIQAQDVLQRNFISRIKKKLAGFPYAYLNVSRVLTYEPLWHFLQRNECVETLGIKLVG